MATLNVLVGIPGCGKSTFAKSGEIPGTVVSSDLIRKMYWTEGDQMHNAEVFAIARDMTSTLLDDGKDVIMDATNLRPGWRKWCIDMAHEKGAQVNAYSFENVPLDTCLERNLMRARKVPAGIIRRMHTQLVTPTKEEGFDEVYFLGAEPELRASVDTTLVDSNVDENEYDVEHD